MKRQYILALDQGTTGSRAFIFDHKSEIVASDYKEFQQYFPKPGWVEHDAEEIWQSCVSVIRGALRKAKINSKEIAAVGITNQRETTILWDKTTSKPIARAIVWQCRRTSSICDMLRKYEKTFHAKTGLVLDPYFSGTKIKWLLDNVKGARKKAKEGKLAFGTIDSWLMWKLTNGQAHVTDMTNASRTLIFNIRHYSWDKELLSILNIPFNILPKVQESGSVFGKTSSTETGLPIGIPIAASIGDQQSALYGQGCYDPGTIKNTYGTGCFLVLNTGKKFISSKSGLLTTIACDFKGRPVYALEGSVFIAGAVIQWLRDQLKVIKASPHSEHMIKHVKDTHGVYFVPAFTGLGAPYWDSEATGLISGLTRGANVNHIVRAALESIAYQTKDVFDLMKKELNGKINQLKVDGGACKNNFLMQFQADILGCSIARPKIVESTALGAARLAGVTVNLWKTKEELNKLYKVDKLFKPRMKEKARNELYSGWKKAVKKTLLKT